MTELSQAYASILLDLEKNIKDEKELEYVKEQFMKLASIFIEQMEETINSNGKRIKELEKKQDEIDRKMESINNIVEEIENDIYMDEEDEEFHIVCPYCNFEFSENFDENRKEIQCPECNNIIELDWNDEDDGCSGHCHGCHGGCGE